jgi:hypothetical protein
LAAPLRLPRRLSPIHLERAVGRRWLAAAASALVMGAYAAQVVVSAAETSLAPIAGIAPSYGPKTVSAVPDLETRLTDPVLDMADKLIGGLFARARRVSGGSSNDRLTTRIGWRAGNCSADPPRGSIGPTRTRP